MKIQVYWKFLFKKRNCIFIVPLLLSMAIWWSPNFLTPGTYYNVGDTVFPLVPEQYLKSVYSAWIPQGLGLPNLFSAFVPFYFVIYMLDFISMPLWFINRLWLMVPTAMVGWTTYYLYASIFKERYSMTAGLIAASFAMLPPMYAVIPVWYISLSGFSLTLGATIRGLQSENKSWSYSVVTAIGFACLTLNPRYFYLAVLTIALYLVISCCVDRRIFTKKTFGFLTRTVIIALIINAFWIIPLIYYVIIKNPALGQRLSSVSYGRAVHREMLLQYKGWPDPLWISRLMTKGAFAGFAYVKQPFIYPFTFIMPLCAFISLLFPFVRKHKRYIVLPIITAVFIYFASSLYYPLTSKLYLYLWDVVPGFVILNNPGFWIAILGILYAVMTGATTQALLLKIDTSNSPLFTLRRKHLTKFLLIAILCILIGAVYGGALLIGTSPEENVWGRSIYMNHVNAAKIPQEYFELRDYLSYHASDGDRILNLPWDFGGYSSYTWWHKSNMPETVSSISPIPVLAVSSIIPKPVFNLVDLLKYHNPQALELLKELGVKFILVHKDYYRLHYGTVSIGGFDDPGHFEDFLRDNINFRKEKDNKYFNLYVLKDKTRPSVYVFQGAVDEHDNNNKEISIKYKKISDTKYKVNPIGKGNFQLILNQSFHPQWKCLVGDREVKEHSSTELGMNKWIITDARNKEITIIFTPQKWINIGIFISCLFGAVLIFGKLRAYYVKRKKMRFLKS